MIKNTKTATNLLKLTAILLITQTRTKFNHHKNKGESLSPLAFKVNATKDTKNPPKSTIPPKPPNSSPLSSPKNSNTGKKKKKKPVNKCTPKSCEHCNPSPTPHCTSCTNGFLLSEKTLSCSIQINIPNCRKGDPEDPQNPNKCTKCQKGYKLLSSTRCTRPKEAKHSDCDNPFWFENRMLCKGCVGKFLKNDYTGCWQGGSSQPGQAPKQFPDFCKYGDREELGSCLACERGFELSQDKFSCKVPVVEGCLVYHPADDNRCAQCDLENGYYAVGAVTEGGDFFQVCGYYGWGLSLKALIGFLGLIMGLEVFGEVKEN